MPDPSRYHKVVGEGGAGVGVRAAGAAREEDSERSWTGEVGIQPQ